MQKDVHFYATLAIAMTSMSEADALKIAWACEYTDHCLDPSDYGIQTQSDILDDWSRAQVQATVLIPFHFVPGDSSGSRWLVTPGNRLSKYLTSEAHGSGDPFRLGIAVHSLQDSYSHQDFTGWRESINSCYPWYYASALVPNVGHAEMGSLPDIVNAIWTDPRTGHNVTNLNRAQAACTQVQDIFGDARDPAVIAPLSEQEYANRVTALQRVAGRPYTWSNTNAKLQPEYSRAFAAAARKHLSLVMGAL